MKAYGGREVYKMSGDWLPIVDEIRNYSCGEVAEYQELLDTLS